MFYMLADGGKGKQNEDGWSRALEDLYEPSSLDRRSSLV